MDDIQRYICNQQRKLYEWISENNYDLKSFSMDFLKSSFCNRSLDKPYSVDQFADELDWIDFMEIDKQYHPVHIDEPYPKRISGWIGFVFRQIQIETRIPSNVLADKIPFERLVVAYAGLHTVDEDMQLEIICKDFNLHP